ncbi:phosphatidylglycerol lysyltransferase domain-containing protein [Nocardia sp. CDC153]|uniref:bifunctional lysylphosphatidylglycerol flippase/synthetase MprF n=1 Tax=Nocardia sp. CDC153 TaxID=3112167 RepID=UPI002DC01ABF|nr:phosphatidylglycerol lysyltransferase domain-containing protein [Nocardia sp. CDC153]MEC3952708.1 phosphatidylglycerol lysyltransferase domain-containing protein [Nocardia sp. CDC153]
MREERIPNPTLTAYRETTFTAGPNTRVGLMGALVLGSVILVWAAERASREGNDHGWFVAVSFAGLFVARGLYLRRPITLPHLTAAAMTLVISNFSYRTDHPVVGFVFLAASGAILVLPQGSKPQPEQLPRVADLVRRSQGDPLAPFALHSSKSYFFNADGSAALAYRARLGIAVVSGDPIGEADRFPELLTEFSLFAGSHGWKIAVLGASPEVTQAWQRRAVDHRGLRSIAIGRDVVIEVGHFDMVGRKFRNLRQAVSRTKNFGVTTEILPEVALTEPQRETLLAIVDEWGHGRQTRGFSMILDHLLDGRHPGMLVVMARDADGRVVGFQRYGVSGNGQELSLDVPWRRHDAPNGLDERMIVDLVEYSRERGIKRISLAFAAFPEIFADKQRSRTMQAVYLAVRLGDPLIRLESLYRFLRKFNSFGNQRYVLLRWREIVIVALALLSLEFVPHRKQY